MDYKPVVAVYTPDFPPGLCIYQKPAANKKVPRGTVVQITIARAPATTTTS